MKKLLFFSGIVIVITAASCKKCYNCTTNGTPGSDYCSDVYTQDQLNSAKSTCESLGSTWAEKK